MKLHLLLAYYSPMARATPMPLDAAEVYCVFDPAEATLKCVALRAKVWPYLYMDAGDRLWLKRHRGRKQFLICFVYECNACGSNCKFLRSRSLRRWFIRRHPPRVEMKLFQRTIIHESFSANIRVHDNEFPGIKQHRAECSPWLHRPPQNVGWRALYSMHGERNTDNWIDGRIFHWLRPIIVHGDIIVTPLPAKKNCPNLAGARKFVNFFRSASPMPRPVYAYISCLLLTQLNTYFLFISCQPLLLAFDNIRNDRLIRFFSFALFFLLQIALNIPKPMNK